MLKDVNGLNFNYADNNHFLFLNILCGLLQLIVNLISFFAIFPSVLGKEGDKKYKERTSGSG